ncbi:Glycerol uptake facilitator protein [Buchnera aphidicola (Neophyllaphis podocarpi)]|uniref:MIP/aquaporin family protein n=1 Tax=Buchnera aphidicola TaxID=9 RepID=UPI00346419E8
MNCSHANFSLKRQCISEFIGTGLIIFFGSGVLAASKLTNINFGQLDISIIWGLGVSIGIYSSMKISGAHLNPAITITLYIFSNFNKKKVIPYIISQMLGSFTSTSLVYFLYYNLFNNFENSHKIVRGTVESLYLAAIFSTYPNGYVSTLKSLIVEIVIAAIFMYVTMTLNDFNKTSYSSYSYLLTPLIIGSLIIVIGTSMGSLTSFALNPARDLSPKIFMWLAGWGSISFTGGRDFPYFFIPLFGSLSGTIIGAFGYIRLTKLI